MKVIKLHALLLQADALHSESETSNVTSMALRGMVFVISTPTASCSNKLLHLSSCLRNQHRSRPTRISLHRKRLARRLEVAWVPEQFPARSRQPDALRARRVGSGSRVPQHMLTTCERSRKMSRTSCRQPNGCFRPK